MGKARIIIKSAILVAIVLIVASCSLKSKTELYLERGLDLLSNKQQVDFALSEKVIVEEVGVIRDKKEGKKVLVLRMHPSTEQAHLDGNKIHLRTRIKQKDNAVRIEEWDFSPNLLEFGGHKYLTTELNVEEDKIRKLSVSLIDSENGQVSRRGPVLTVINLWTYND